MGEQRSPAGNATVAYRRVEGPKPEGSKHGGQPRRPRRAATADSATLDDQCHPRKIFVGGLAHKTSTQHLRDYFQRFGSIIDAVVLRWPDGRSRGFGYVTFNDASAASAALKCSHAVGGRQVDVKRAVPGTNKLFVGGLPQNTTAAELREHFEKFGVVSDAVVMIDPATSRSRGFGFVCFLPGQEGSAAVTSSLEEYSNHRIRGKWIEVKGAAPPHKLLSKEDGGQEDAAPVPLAAPPGSLTAPPGVELAPFVAAPLMEQQPQRASPQTTKPDLWTATKAHATQRLAAGGRPVATPLHKQNRRASTVAAAEGGKHAEVVAPVSVTGGAVPPGLLDPRKVSVSAPPGLQGPQGAVAPGAPGAIPQVGPPGLLGGRAFATEAGTIAPPGIGAWPGCFAGMPSSLGAPVPAASFLAWGQPETWMNGLLLNSVSLPTPWVGPPFHHHRTTSSGSTASFSSFAGSLSTALGSSVSVSGDAASKDDAAWSAGDKDIGSKQAGEDLLALPGSDGLKSDILGCEHKGSDNFGGSAFSFDTNMTSDGSSLFGSTTDLQRSLEQFVKLECERRSEVELRGRVHAETASEYSESTAEVEPQVDRSAEPQHLVGAAA